MDCRPLDSKGGGDAIHQCPLDAVALCFLLTCALLMTSSHSEGGEYSVVEDSFVKVNDDSTKLYNTGVLLQLRSLSSPPLSCCHWWRSSTRPTFPPRV